MECDPAKFQAHLTRSHNFEAWVRPRTSGVLSVSHIPLAMPQVPARRTQSSERATRSRIPNRSGLAAYVVWGWGLKPYETNTLKP